MRAGCRVDHLRGIAHATAGSTHRAFEDLTDAEFPADLLHIDRLAFVYKARIAGETKSQRMRESAVMISSTMPSAKYSCSGSQLMLAKGSTAIDGLSGSSSGGEPPSPPSRRWRPAPSPAMRGREDPGRAAPARGGGGGAP